MKKTPQTEITPALLAGWPLPQHDEGDDKEGRGRIFVAGGSAEIPGALILSSLASLRAGAGQLKIATGESIARHVAVAVLEAWVVSLPETPGGGFHPACAGELAENAENANAVLIGPGMQDEEATRSLLHALLPQVHTPTVLDAAALACLHDAPHLLHSLDGNVIVTPHAGEMAGILGRSKDDIKADPCAAAIEAAASLRAVVAMKGSETFIATPEGRVFCNRHGCVGLATSGSGDTLAGIIAGLAARGATAEQATVWGVFLHAKAGEILAERVGPLGFLARELLAEIPRLMWETGKAREQE